MNHFLQILRLFKHHVEGFHSQKAQKAALKVPLFSKVEHLWLATLLKTAYPYMPFASICSVRFCECFLCNCYSRWKFLYWPEYGTKYSHESVTQVKLCVANWSNIEMIRQFPLTFIWPIYRSQLCVLPVFPILSALPTFQRKTHFCYFLIH